MVVQAIIVLNLVVFAAQLALTSTGEHAIEDFLRAYSSGPLDEPWRLMTYAFLHGGFLHLGGNMLFLWVFGPGVEDTLGRLGFSVFYLAGAAAAALAQHVFDQSPAIGASGAVAAVTGAALVFFPRVSVRLLIVFILITVIEVPVLWFVAFAIVKDFVLQLGGEQGVAYMAHLGGYAMGLSVGSVLVGFRFVPRESFDLFSMIAQSKRRRDIREAARRAERRPGPARATPASADESAILEARSRAVAQVAQEQWGPAAASVRELRRLSAGAGHTLALPKRSQLDLAHGLFAAGLYADAAEACADFGAAYRDDAAAAHLSLLRVAILARYLGRSDEAREALRALAPRLPASDDAALAAELARELGMTDLSPP